ncbi:MAG: AIR synthase family protein [Candidatus Omnitrophica bacterium]|nr:AIR synthase family protein [Candidatus Omnitrophota bacterium]MDD5027012.1 AIR synthase family protein [Candidatus Omnitrophota bacterium]MDD5661766.1 AIR synthase family protein [Candidatus Omnitrophota bacterium]
MSELPALGKIHPEFFTKFIYPKLGNPDSSVIVKPFSGVDFGVVDLGDRVMVLSTDPFYIAAGLGMEKAAWFAVHILASDVAVSGIAPRYLAVDLNLPPEITEDELIRMWNTVDSECKKLGISIVTGHTARYAGCNYPFVGGATVFGIDKKEKLVRPQAKIGDAVIISKGAAIETTGLMAAYFPKYLEKRFGKEFVRCAQDVYYQMSTVKDALIVAKAGKVTAMHDATECGVFGGLYEIAGHSQVGMHIWLDKIIIQETVKKTCECFNIDPYRAISEGTLLATIDKSNAQKAVDALSREGIPASIAGEVVEKEKGITVVEGKNKFKLTHPGTDPFWQKFEEYLKK